jgi:hypothetical protein
MIAIKNYFLKLIKYLINLVELQLLLTNVVLPFTIYWGMAISPISMISTLIGTPIVFLIIILTIINYLFISLGIKISILIELLEIVCKIWQKFITFKINTPLIIIPNLSTELLLATTIIYALIYYKIKHKKLISIYFSILYFLLIYVVSNLLYVVPESVFFEKIRLEYNKQTQKLTLIVDKIPKNFVDWHFRSVLPTIRKNYGQNHVDIIKLKKNNKTAQKYLEEINPEKFYTELILDQAT